MTLDALSILTGQELGQHNQSTGCIRSLSCRDRDISCLCHRAGRCVQVSSTAVKELKVTEPNISSAIELTLILDSCESDLLKQLYYLVLLLHPIRRRTLGWGPGFAKPFIQNGTGTCLPQMETKLVELMSFWMQGSRNTILGVWIEALKFSPRWLSTVEPRPLW